VVFLVGGAGGLSDAVRAAARKVVSLGPQTVSHELAQVILAEQLYRAWTILRGEPYHK
jgi:23S rRNA (pseudouridine1915-N3)-methyltransferase